MSRIEKVNLTAMKTNSFDYKHKAIKTAYLIPMDTFSLRVDKVETKDFGEIVKCKVFTDGTNDLKNVINGLFGKGGK